MGLFDWFRRGSAAAIPEAVWQRTVAGLPFLAALDATDRQRLKTLSEAFLGAKQFTAAGGLELNDEICVAIAAQGCLPILNLGLAAYRDWVGIVVYPDEFVVPREIHDEAGVVHEYDDVLSGEAWQGGPLLVSWHDVQMAGAGYNVVIDRVGSAPLGECFVTNVRNPQQVTQTIPVGEGKYREYITVVTSQSITVSLNCDV